MREETTCRKVHDLPETRRCHFVLNTPDCVTNMNFINYLGWHFCKVDVGNGFNTFWSVVGMLLMAIYVFWMMQMTINK